MVVNKVDRGREVLGGEPETPHDRYFAIVDVERVDGKLHVAGETSEPQNGSSWGDQRLELLDGTFDANRGNCSIRMGRSPSTAHFILQDCSGCINDIQSKLS